MSWNPTTEGSTQNQSGGNGLYSSTDTQEDSSLRVQLGEHLDPSTRGALESGPTTMTPNAIMDFVKRNPVPLALAAGGLLWLLTSRRWRR